MEKFIRFLVFICMTTKGSFHKNRFYKRYIRFSIKFEHKVQRTASIELKLKDRLLKIDDNFNSIPCQHFISQGLFQCTCQWLFQYHTPFQHLLSSWFCFGLSISASFSSLCSCIKRLFSLNKIHWTEFSCSSRKNCDVIYCPVWISIILSSRCLIVDVSFSSTNCYNTLSQSYSHRSRQVSTFDHSNIIKVKILL